MLVKAFCFVDKYKHVTHKLHVPLYCREEWFICALKLTSALAPRRPLL